MQDMLTRTFVILSFFLALNANVHAQSVLERQNSGKTTNVSRDDKEMRAAYAKARSTLPNFLKMLDSLPLNVESMAIKLGIPGGGHTEYFWISDIRREGANFVGRIGNQPNYATHLSIGDQVRFSRGQIVDWTYRNKVTGRLVGNFTGCAILRKEPAADRQRFAEATGLYCD